MNIFKDALNSILSKIQEIHDTVSQISLLFKKIFNFFDIISSIIPVEIFLLLLGIALLMLVLNSLSPTTPRFNLMVALLILDFIWYNLNLVFMKESGILKIVSWSLVILLPAYGISGSKWLFRFFKKRQLIAKLKKGDMDSFREQLGQSYHRVMGHTHEISGGNRNNVNELKNELKKLTKICEELNL